MLKACLKHHHHHYHYSCPPRTPPTQKPSHRHHPTVKPFDCKEAFSRKQWKSITMRKWRMEKKITKPSTVENITSNKSKKSTPSGYCYVPYTKCHHVAGSPSNKSQVLFTPSQFKSVINTDKHRSFSIIWDSGASVCITPDKNDFIKYSTVTNIKSVRSMGGNISEIKGQGQVIWSVHDTNDMLWHLKLNAYHIPLSTFLLSTSCLLNTYKNKTITVDDCSLTLSGIGNDWTRSLVIAYNDPVTHLPTTIGYRYNDIDIPNQTLANFVHTVHTDNKNLKRAKKELLRWHYCLGHLSFHKIQHLMKTGALSHKSSSCALHTASSKLTHPPKCAACLFGKQVAWSLPGTTTTVVKDRAGVLELKYRLTISSVVSKDAFLPGTTKEAMTVDM